MDEVRKVSKKLSLSLKRCLDLYLEKEFDDPEKDYIVFPFLGFCEIVVGRCEHLTWITDGIEQGFVWWIDSLELKMMGLDQKEPIIFDELKDVSDDIYSWCSSLT